MTTYTDKYRASDIILSEANGTLSREKVTILSGTAAFEAGMVLGQITKAGTAVAAAYAGNTGNGTMGTVTVGANAIPGVYKLTITEPGTNVGNFLVEDPNGVTIGQGDVATAFSAGGLSFTLADGSTDFVAGDGFTITIDAGSLKYKPYDDDNTDGSEVAVCIALEAVDASAADVDCAVLYRLAEYKADLLQWASTNDAGDKTAGIADLAARNLIGR